MSTTIRLAEESKRKLAALKRDGESFDDALSRLLESHEERDFAEGFGILADSDTGERVREAHEAMDRGIDERVREIAGRNGVKRGGADRGDGERNDAAEDAG